MLPRPAAVSQEFGLCPSVSLSLCISVPLARCNVPSSQPDAPDSEQPGWLASLHYVNFRPGYPEDYFAENAMLKVALLIAFVSFLRDEQIAKQISPKAESVIARYIQAKGGESALKKIKDYAIKGDVVSDAETVGTFEIYQAANRHLSIHRFPDGSSRKHGTDGKIAWALSVDGKPSILQGQDARDYMRHYETLHESLEWTKQFQAILYAGEKNLGDESVHHLIFVASDNRQINRYFSRKTGLFVREEQITGTQENTQILVSEIRDYVREKNGSLVSRSRLNHFGSGYSIEYRIKSVESNSLSEKTFEVPKSVAELRDNLAK